MPIPARSLAAQVSGTTVKFVDSISATPTVRLDINDGDDYRIKDQGSNFDPPEMRRTVAETMLRDGGLVSASSLENRTITLPIVVQGSTVDDASTKLRALIAQLNREQNILQMQWGSTPLFFRTFRSLGVSVETTDAALSRFVVTCQILAEPFAYGVRVDQAGVSVKADPAQTNGCYLDVNGVTGDIATPAYVTLSNGTVSGLQSPTYLASRSRGTPASLQFVYQAESAARGTDTVLAGSHDAGASGAGNNYTVTDFAVDATMRTRLTFTIAAAELRGSYRLLVRVKQSVSTDTFKLEVSLGDFTAAAVTDSVPGPVITTGWRTIDLGVVQLPPGVDSDHGYDGTYPGTSGGKLNLRAQRVAGTGTLSIDYLLLVPADEALTVFQGTTAWSGSTVVLDGPNDTAYRAVGGLFDFTTSGWSASRAGSLPLLHPGSNRLFFVENISTQVVTDSSTVAVSYWPRYLVL